MLSKIVNDLLNRGRKAWLKTLYPNIKIDKNTIIEKNCKIVCVDGGTLEIYGSRICQGAYIFADTEARVIIGQNCYVGRYSVIVAKGSIVIEDNVLIAEMVVIRDQDHIIEKDTNTNYNISPIHIQNGVWIASKATILKGVTVGSGCVIAASAVVTRSVPSYQVWGGVPAKFIKNIY